MLDILGIITEQKSFLRLSRPLAEFMGHTNALFLTALADHRAYLRENKNLRSDDFYFSMSYVEKKWGISSYTQNKALDELSEMKLLKRTGRAQKNQLEIRLIDKNINIIMHILFEQYKKIELNTIYKMFWTSEISSKNFKNRLGLVLKNLRIESVSFKNFKNPYNETLVEDINKIKKDNETSVNFSSSNNSNTVQKTKPKPFTKTELTSEQKFHKKQAQILFAFLYKKKMITTTRIDMNKCIKSVAELNKQYTEDKIISVTQDYISYFDHIYNGYQVASVPKFCEHFTKIMLEINKCKNPSQYTPSYTKDLQSPSSFHSKPSASAPADPLTPEEQKEVDRIYKELNTTFLWEHVDKAELRRAVEQSTVNYMKFKNRHRKFQQEEASKQTIIEEKARKTHKGYRTSEWLAYARELSINYNAVWDYMVQWFSNIHDMSCTWDKFNGSLKAFVWSPRHKNFYGWGKHFTADYGKKSEKWDEYLRLLGY